MRTAIRCLLCLLLSAVSAGAFAQSIKGTITDSLGRPVPYANVTLKGSGNIIMAFTTSNPKGAYTLDVPEDASKSGLLIEVSFVGYKKQSKAVTDMAAPLNFKLLATSKKLDEVTIKNSRPHLKVTGDTTSYKVSDFSSPQDRVIGDVIKKLPGITVANDGKISYNGKGISNLYLGGDNLLDDKYNIATNSIPHGSVDQVQVLENNQPIKALKDKVVSDDVALNLTFKPDAKLKWVGQETVGAGLPGKYEEDLNAMAFKDKFKAINYLKGNNTGFDLQNDIISHNMSDYLSRLDNDKPATVLSLGTAGDPDLPRSRYLFDRSGIINLNNLYNIKKDVQVKANMYYLHDTQTQDYTKYSQLFVQKPGHPELPPDTIRYSELQQNKRNPDILHGQITLNINKDKYFLNDILLTDYSHNTNNSDLVSNGGYSGQVFKGTPLDFSNEFRMINTTKSNKIYEVYAYVDRITDPETLTIAPNLNPLVFNNGNAYAQLIQTTNVPTWFTNNYFSYKIPSDLVTQSYKIGGSLQSQNMQSSLSLVQNNNSTNLRTADSQNNLDWTKSKLYTEAAYDVPGSTLKLTVTLPLVLQQINYSDSHFVLDKSLTRLYFNPRVSGRYNTGTEHYVSFGYNFNNAIGSIQDVYRGEVLKNYRTLYANNADLTERQTQSANMGFNYRKAITLFFFGVNGGYTHSVSNNISSSVVNSSVTQRLVLPFDNAFDAWQASSSISKYLFNLRSTVSAGVSWQSSHSTQLFNTQFLAYNTISTTYNAGVESKLSDKVNLSYKAYYTQTGSELQGSTTKSKIQQLQQTGAINYAPLTNLNFKLSGDHYYTHQDNGPADLKYIFADFAAKYKFNKIKTDVELSAVNLADVRTYSALYLSDNNFTSNTYSIPGRYFLMRVYFTM
jgi:hypothetical protein